MYDLGSSSSTVIATEPQAAQPMYDLAYNNNNNDDSEEEI